MTERDGEDIYDYYLISINFNFHSKFLTQFVDTMPEFFLLDK